MAREVTVTLPFAPRPWQRPLLTDDAKNIVAVVHRRAGKSTALMWRGIRRALTINRTDNPARIIHTLPYGVQWDRTGLWDRLAAAGRAIPGAEVRVSDMRVVLPNGGIYQAGGMDKPDSWRGGYADEVILDEYDDTKAEGQATAILPMLADYGGTLVRSGTPKGNQLLRDAYDRAGVEPGHSRYFLTYRDTGALSNDAIESLRREMSAEEFAQEMECSFETPNAGSYYGKLMREAREDGRITRVPADPALPVETWWDLGIDDAMSIWFAQRERSGMVRMIDYYENTGEGLPHYIHVLDNRKYRYSRHIAPHDIKVRELSSGKSRLELAGELGLDFDVAPALSIEDGREAVRMLLPLCVWDAEKCLLGLKALEQHRREYDEKRKVFRPLHDWTSHAADSFRMGAIADPPLRGGRIQYKGSPIV